MNTKTLLLFLTLAHVTFQSTFAQSTFITTWNTSLEGGSCGTCIEIPTNPDETYDYNVDWDNDGTFDEFGISGSVIHDFGSPGVYTIRIDGLFPALAFIFSRDGKKL